LLPRIVGKADSSLAWCLPFWLLEDDPFLFRDTNRSDGRHLTVQQYYSFVTKFVLGFEWL
jgi:hypothetical protein